VKFKHIFVSVVGLSMFEENHVLNFYTNIVVIQNVRTNLSLKI
jgi:hypothetical protein